MARAERVALLVDASAFFAAFHQAALRARRSITILGWDFNSRTRLHFDPVGPGDPPAVLGDLLNYVARKRPGLHIQILNWDYPLMFALDRELPAAYGFGWKRHRRIELHYDDTHPIGGCQHQKIALIDDRVAFVGGIDLTVRRWDTPEHAADDERRRAYGKRYPPFHDLMVAVDGDAARTLAAIARERWRNATGSRRKIGAANPIVADPWPPELKPDLTRIDVGIARTAPPHGDDPGVKEVERLYLDMIRAARDTIYIENQYFTSERIAAVLEARLAEPDGPEVVLVLRLSSHGWLEEATMHVLRARLIGRLRAADPHGRFHVYTPHVPGLAENQCLDVHSKLMVVDDEVLRIGSANLCNRSMSIDTECDVAIEARGEARVARVIRGFRDRLIAEHLGVSTERLEHEVRERSSLHGAIEALGSDGRSLRELDQVPDYPEALFNLAELADPDEPISFEVLDLERSVDDSPSARARPWGRIAAITALVLALTAAWRLTPLADLVSGERIVGWAKEFGGQPWAPLAIILAYTPACFIMFPRPLITLAAVIAFGAWLGFFCSLGGIVLSAVVTYFVGKWMRADTIRRVAGPHVDEMVEVLERHGLLAMTLLRLVPLAPFFVQGVVSGALGLKLWHLAAGTAIGVLPGTVAAAFFGVQLEIALAGGRINWWIVGACVAVLGLGAILVKRWFSKKARRIDRNPEERSGMIHASSRKHENNE